MDFFVPSLLNDLAGEAEQDARAVLDLLERTPNGGVVDPRPLVPTDARARQKLEQDRRGRFALMLETLTDKYENAARTTALIESIKATGRPFVLFLRGFSLKQHYAAGGSTGFEADLGEYRARFDLSTAIAPVPMVIVRNPATSESLIGVFDGAQKAAPTTFAVDLDERWQRGVEAFVQAASYIVVRNAVPGPGLDAELDMIRRRGRLRDTFFSNPAAVPGDLARAGAQALDDRALARMRGAAARVAPAHVEWPSPPTCLWIQGQRRRRVADNAFFIFDFLNRLAGRGERMPRDLQGRLLFSTVGMSIVLERLDLLVMALSSYAHVVSQYRPDELPGADGLVRGYGAMFMDLARAIDVSRGADVLDCQDLERLTRLMRDGEDPDRLIRTTMRVVQGLQVKQPDRSRTATT